jgi:hypothetical protein
MVRPLIMRSHRKAASRMATTLRAEDGWAWLKLLLQALPQVVEQMNAIRHLPGLGSPLPSSFGVKAVAVTADDLHFGMPAQPIGDALG